MKINISIFLAVALGAVAGYLLHMIVPEAPSKDAIELRGTEFDEGVELINLSVENGTLTGELFLDEEGQLLGVTIATPAASWEFTMNPSTNEPRVAIRSAYLMDGLRAGEISRFVDANADGVPDFVFDESMIRVPIRLEPAPLP